MEQAAPSRRSIAMASIAIFAIAITIRVPSCYESFWLDELHSAWCINDSFGDVFPRADIGHQSPFYFVGLWIWQQLVGDAEVALRLSSVLAVAASCVVLTIGVIQWTGRLAAGVAAGLIMSLESNSLFFGTELRPYAFVILFASVAAICFIRLISADSRREHRGCWSVFMVAILMAAIAQPTSVGVLLWLLVVLLAAWFARNRRELFKFTLVDGLVALTVAAFGFTIWNTTLSETWQQRGVWSHFADATRWGQIWHAWDWIWLLIVPLALTASIAAVGRDKVAVRRVVITSAMLALVAVGATSVYWLVSRAGVAPLWHRRYFIAVLPLFACVVGGAVAVTELATGPSRKQLTAGAIAAVVLVFWPPQVREMIYRLRHYPVALVSRGEDWRGAAEWVRARAQPNDFILLDAGLIEANSWLAPNGAEGLSHHSDAARREYLTYPLRGPYSLQRNIVPIRPNDPIVFLSNHPKRRIYRITRRPRRQIRAALPFGSRVVGFGNLTVIQQSSVLDRSF